eukprot:scaffold14934_cov22-Prasinocladus_malaysianus.AAC.1
MVTHSYSEKGELSGGRALEGQGTSYEYSLSTTRSAIDDSIRPLARNSCHGPVDDRYSWG